jgi:hypothetical protein
VIELRPLSRSRALLRRALLTASVPTVIVFLSRSRDGSPVGGKSEETMKKSSSLKKLKLHRETIRTLTTEEAKQAAGGHTIIPATNFFTCTQYTYVSCAKHNCMP